MPWHKPWTSAGDAGLPRNLQSRRKYRGINVWLLLARGYASPLWLTYNQARALGGHVRAGEKGVHVVFWKVGAREVQDGEETSVERTFLARSYVVFNIAQTEGLPVSGPPAPTAPRDPLPACEQVLAGWPAAPAILHGFNHASYDKREDVVRMPQRADFESQAAYFGTAFQELTHSTGHPSRLNRDSLMDSERFGDENYSKEELIAELGAAYLSGMAGIENCTINQSASYINGWITALKGDSRLLISAASQAQRAADLILGQRLGTAWTAAVPLGAS